MAQIKNTRAKVLLSASQIHQILDLPDDLQVLNIGATFDPPGAVVVVYGDHLTEVREDAELPYLHGSLSREAVVVNGKVYSRFSWSAVDYDEMFKAEPAALWQVKA